ncbi:MAG: uracil-DNA glycosylase [Thermosipho sp. (in: Bacteria)]|nr:uracil-DNA glycosylase [Thermosipho sp. (in: thermotogales)]
MDKKELMDIVIERIKNCKSCPLWENRTNVVPGEGSLDSPIVFVGEGPGEEEDLTGRPFVGRAGQLLTKILESVNIKREDVYITNIVKCRPPNNRTPTKEEAKTCSHFLLAQIEIINPKMIVTLGKAALDFFAGGNFPITKVRGNEFEWKGGVIVFPMFHPSYLLRNPSKAKGSPKDLTWQDIKRVKKYYDQFLKERKVNG